MKVAVVGGGISGLVATLELKKQNIEVELYEKSGVLGGIIQTSELGGLTVDQGPDSFLARVPEGIELCEELGFNKSNLVSPISSKVLLKTKNGLEELIQPHILGVPLDPEATSQYVNDFSLASQIQNDLLVDLHRTELEEPSISEDTIGAYVRRRVGDAIYERQVAPLIGAISASDPDFLSLESATPLLLEARTSPSLIKGLIKGSTPTGPAFYAPKSGMGSLVEKLAKELKEAVKLNSPVENLEDLQADFIVLAVPAFVASDLLAKSKQHLDSVQLLNEIEFVSVGMVQFVYDEAQLPEEFLGTAGVLFDKKLGLNITAVSFSTQKWGTDYGTNDEVGNSPKEVLRISVGDYKNDQIVNMSNDEIYSLVLNELATELGITQKPTASRINCWYQSFPQYFPANSSSKNSKSHLEKIDLIKAELLEHKIYLAGSSLNGVGIPACIRSGKEAAHSICLFS